MSEIEIEREKERGREVDWDASVKQVSGKAAQREARGVEVWKEGRYGT